MKVRVNKNFHNNTMLKTYSSYEVVLLNCLILMAERQGSTIETTKKELLEFMGKKKGGNATTKINMALDNLKKVPVRIEKFYEDGTYSDYSFKVIKDYEAKRRSLHVCFDEFFLSKVLSENYFNLVPLNYYSDLKKTSWRLYEFLCGKFNERMTFEIGIIKLADRIPMAYRSDFPSKIKPYFLELRKKTDLNIEIDIKGKGEERKFIFTRKQKGEKNATIPNTKRRTKTNNTGQHSTVDGSSNPRASKQQHQEGSDRIPQDKKADASLPDPNRQGRSNGSKRISSGDKCVSNADNQPGGSNGNGIGSGDTSAWDTKDALHNSVNTGEQILKNMEKALEDPTPIPGNPYDHFENTMQRKTNCAEIAKAQQIVNKMQLEKQIMEKKSEIAGKNKNIRLDSNKPEQYPAKINISNTDQFVKNMKKMKVKEDHTPQEQINFNDAMLFLGNELIEFMGKGIGNSYTKENIRTAIETISGNITQQQLNDYFPKFKIFLETAKQTDAFKTIIPIRKDLPAYFIYLFGEQRTGDFYKLRAQMEVTEENIKREERQKAAELEQERNWQDQQRRKQEKKDFEKQVKRLISEKFDFSSMINPAIQRAKEEIGEITGDKNKIKFKKMLLKGKENLYIENNIKTYLNDNGWSFNGVKMPGTILQEVREHHAAVMEAG
jgi:uncharacterized protein YaiL (DUF2058 family)